MKNYILNTLFTGCLITASLHAMDNQAGMMGSNMMMQHMKEITENDLLNSLSDQEQNIYQHLNPQQKDLVLRVANQFSCRAQMRKMHQKMMQ